MCFSPKGTAFAARSRCGVPEGYAFPSDGPTGSWVRRLLFSHLQGLDHRTTRQAKTSTGGDFLNASPATILTVRVCEQLNIVGFLYLLVPFLYPVLEKTFYSFLVQKKLGTLCSSAVFNYVTPPTLFFLGIHLPAEGFIKQPSALSQPCGPHYLHTPNKYLRELASSGSRDCAKWNISPSSFPPSPHSQTFVGV